MANVCVIDRGDDKNGYIQALPDCPHAPPCPPVDPGPYNVFPVACFWGALGLLVFCVFVAILYNIRRSSKVQITRAMIDANVPGLIKRMEKLEGYAGGK